MSSSQEPLKQGAMTRAARASEPPPVPMPPDLDALFREAYARLHGPLIDHSERFLDRDRACDAVDDALADLYRRWPQLTPEQRTDSYVYRMVQNQIFDALKAAERFVPLDKADALLATREEPDLDGRPTEADLAEILDRALQAMPAKRRATFLLIREENLRYADAAEILGVSFETVKMHMKLALEDLRVAFTRAGIRIANEHQHRLPKPNGGAIHD